MFYSDLFRTVEKICTFVSFWQTLPFQWDTSSGKLISKENIKKPLLWGKWYWLAAMILILTIQNVLAPSTTPIIDKMLGGVVVSISYALVAPYYAYLKKDSTVMLYVNGVFQFLRRQNRFQVLELKRTLIELLNIVCALGIFVTGLFIPIMLSFGLHWTNPCKPSLIGYWLLPECFNIVSPRFEDPWVGVISSKVVLLVVNQGTLHLAYPACMFGFSVVQILVMIMLNDCLRIFWAKLNKAESREMRESCWLLHREIQLLSDLNNYIQQWPVVTLYMVVAIVQHGFSVCGLIRIIKQPNADIVGIFLFSVIVMDTFLVIVVAFGGMSKVIEDSRKMIHESKRHLFACCGVSCAERRWVRQFMRSCPIIKIKFGSNNFVEALTPLNCLSSALEIAVQLLLLDD